MERDGKEFIIHRIFVGDMKRVPMAKHGLEKCSRGFEITGRLNLMESLMGLEIELA